MNDNLSLAQKALVLVCTPLLFQILFVAILGMLLSQAEYERREEAHAKDVATKATTILRLIIEAGATVAIEDQARQYIKTDGLVRKGEAASEHAQEQFDLLKQMVSGRPDEEAAIARIGVVEENIRSCLRRARKANHRGDSIAALSQYAQVNRLVSEFTDAVDAVTEQQGDIQRKKALAAEQSRRLITVFLLLGVVFNIFLALFIAFVFYRGAAYRLSILMDNTRKLGKGLPLNPPIGGKDEISHLDNVFQEMAVELHEARRKEQAIIANAKDVICSLDGDGRFSAVNPAVKPVLGYTPEELIGKNWRDLIVESDREKTESAIARIIKGVDNIAIENRALRSDGRELDIVWSAHWSVADDSLFCVAHDITERKEVERMKREFVAMVSHDLRTPLTSIQMYLSLLGTGVYGNLNDNGLQNLQCADGSINRLINLINDLLDAEKLESGKFEINCTDISMGDVLEDAVMSVQAYAEQQGVVLDLIPYDSDVHADGDRLIQVVVNLLSNAVKFSPRESRVTVSAVEHPDCVEVRITDRGRGIPQEQIGTIFDKFTQVSKADAKKMRGSGLGLSICKAIVERHGGVIGVSSEEGNGSTFWFKIPRIAMVPPTDPVSVSA